MCHVFWIWKSRKSAGAFKSRRVRILKMNIENTTVAGFFHGRHFVLMFFSRSTCRRWCFPHGEWRIFAFQGCLCSSLLFVFLCPNRYSRVLHLRVHHFTPNLGQTAPFNSQTAGFHTALKTFLFKESSVLKWFWSSVGTYNGIRIHYQFFSIANLN